MPNFPLPKLPSLPDVTAPLKALRKVIRDAKKGVRDSAEELKEIGKELHEGPKE